MPPPPPTPVNSKEADDLITRVVDKYVKERHSKVPTIYSAVTATSSSSTENVTNIDDEMEIEDFVLPVNGYEGDFVLPVNGYEGDFVLPVNGYEGDFVLPVNGYEGDFITPNFDDEEMSSEDEDEEYDE